MLKAFNAAMLRLHNGINLLFIIWVIAAQLCCVQQTFCSEVSSFDPDDDVEVFSSQEISITKLPDEAFLPKIESIYIKTKIRFRYSRTRITSKIVNPNKQKAQNVSYTLRIPNESFISRFEMRIDNAPKVYRAKVYRAEDARKMIQFAVGEGRTVTLGLVEQSQLDFNEVSLNFVIGAGKEILFSLIYESSLERKDDQYESVAYLVPDYITNKTHFRVEVVIEENLRVMSIRVPLDVEYSSHNASISRESSSKATISWSNYNSGEMISRYPRSEFIVLYSLENEISTGHVLLRNGFFIHFWVPTSLDTLRKHIIFILDISDSMTGIKMNQIISAMKDILDELKHDDFFNIVTFSSEAHVWSCLYGEQKNKLFPFPADPECKAEARRFIETIQPKGSTNMHDALVKGLEIAKNVSAHSSLPQNKPANYRRGEYRGRTASWSQTIPSGVQSLIIFFTDGEPTSGIIDKRSLLTTVKIMNFNLSVPIFSLAFGKSADFLFLSKLSTRNRAFARKIYEDADSSFQLANFYREISSPVLANLSFKYETSSSTMPTSLVTSGYNMAFQGQEILTLGKLNDWPGLNETRHLFAMNASVTGVGRSGTRVFRIPIKDCTKAGSCQDEGDFDDKCVEKIFVYLTIKRRMQEMFLLEDDDEGKLEAEQIKEKVTETALEYGLITMFTSMVMRTRSVGEEEMDDLGVNPGQGTGVEVFLGSQTPLVDRSKVVQEIDIDSIRKNEVGRLPKKDPTTISQGLDRFDVPLIRFEYYNLFEVSNNASNNVIVGNNSTSHNLAMNQYQTDSTTDHLHLDHNE